MKIKKAYYLTATILILLAGCDRGLPTEPEGGYQIESVILDGNKTGMFKVTGAINDQGIMEGEPLPVEEGAGTRVVRYRMFISEKGFEHGFIAVRIEGHYGSDGSYLVEGFFNVLESSGPYADVQKQGTFHALLDENDRPVEYFSGRLH